MLFRLLAACAVVLSVGACTSSTPNAPSPVATILCPLEQSVVNTVVVAVASELQCSNQAAVLASVNALPVVGTICASPAAVAIGKPKAKAGEGLPLKSIGSDLCTTVASGLLASGASAAIPAAWGCSAANAEASLSSVISAACLKVFP
jgi:hypothetical protein